MDNIPQELGLLELKQGNVCKTLEELHSRAFSELKDFKNNLDSCKSLLQFKFKQLADREKEIRSKEEKLEAKENQFNSEMKAKENQFNSELEAKEIRFYSELEAKEIQFNKEYESRFETLNGIEKLIKEYSEELEVKRQEVESINSLIQNICNELEAKKKLCNSIQMSIEEKKREYNRIGTSISRDAERLILLEKSMQQKSEENQRVLKEFEDVSELKESRLNKVQRSFDKCTKELALKAGKLEVLEISINECEQKIKLKEEKLGAIKNSIKEFSDELESKKMQLDYVRKMRQQEFESSRKSVELGLRKKTNIPHSVVKTEKLEKTPTSSASHQSYMTEEKENLIVLLKSHDYVSSEIFAFLRASSDPAKLMLEAMQGIYHLHSNRKDKEFDETIMRRRSILLSELLMKASPRIDPQVQQEAMKLARNWQATMKVSRDNCLEVFGFLQFLVSFRLASAFDVSELQSLLDAVVLNGRASKLLTAICSVDKAPDVVESVQKLIESGEVVHAVKHICALKLTEKFSPEKLLVEYLEDAKNSTSIICKGRRSNEAKKKARDKEVAILKAVKECIKDCNLQSGFSILSYKIRPRLVELENKIQLMGPDVEQLRKRKNDNAAAASSQGRPQIKIKYSGKNGSE